MAEEEPQRLSKQLAELHQDTPREHGISVIREPSPEELDRIERADRLIVESANAAPYQRCREVLEVVMAAIADLQDADPAGPGQLASVRAAFGSLAVALEELVTRLQGAVSERVTSDAASDFGKHVDSLRLSESLTQVQEIADAKAGSFKLAPGGAAVWQRRSDDAILVPAEVGFSAVSAGQDLLVRHYVALEPALIDAARLLRQLAVETPGGTPGIVELTLRGEQPDLSNLKPRVLAVNRIEVALRAARLASRTMGSLEQSEEPEEQGEPGAEPDQAEPTAKGPAAEPDEAESTAEDEGGEPTAEQGEAEASHEGERDNGAGKAIAPPPQPVEFDSLFRVARTLDSDLEKVWSAALDEALLEAALEKQVAAVGSLLSALQRKVATQEAALGAAGIDARITEWPLSAETLAELDLSRDEESQTTQLRLAQLDALLGVTQMFEGLRQPANVTVSFDQSGESVERFWSAGAFALLRDRLSLLQRITRQHDRDLDRTLGEEAREEAAAPPMEAFDRLRLGTQAWVRGDPEAALFHAVVAVAAVLEVPISELPQKLADHADQEEPGLSQEDAAILSLAAASVNAAFEGKPNLPIATLLAQAALRTAHLLILGPLTGQSLSAAEMAELIESRQPLQPLEPEADAGDA